MVESNTMTSFYDAYNEEGYKLSLSYSSETMDIELKAPEKLAEFKWPDSDIAKLLPKPDSNIGRIEQEAEDRLAIYVGGTSIEAFGEYVDKVKSAGFEVDYQKGDTYYQADNADGYHVDITYEGNDIIFIIIDAPDEESQSMDETTGSKADSEEIIEKEDDETDPDQVDPELKAFLNDYEEFIDEYIEFMEKYSESGNPAGMLADYTDMVQKYTEFANKLDQYNAEEMSPADATYYVEVTARCSEKLMKASL